MPSFKACLIAVAAVALAFAPVDATSRREAAAASLERRAGVDRTGLNKGQYKTKSAFLQTPQALAVARIRCGTDNVCAARGDPPANGAAVCIAGRCTFRCLDGFNPGGDGTQCVAAINTCNGVTCDVPDNGYATCENGACSAACNAGFSRYSLSADGTAPYFCFATATDANNCGTPGNACPASYNGIGEPACKNGACRVACPAGSFLRRAQSVSNPFYCYSGEDSLVRN
ncbi:hypothetical protein JCM11251_004001 [Rhodosporidiobolus azoricus]